jgi:hypothetical protein
MAPACDLLRALVGNRLDLDQEAVLQLDDLRCHPQKFL